ncbi:hypothetical protein FNV43_RR13410 [Rhamnella rubrinervis]|uniref:Uncharacterized protein n=1 Tax=Rhamnella rubrinervis TaxID=2594499 RepID=A0A8K0MF56_9ROSA|nr:hypothetical protein FNV43_RR13410 [Rhamnella rubrinervis]
MTKKGGKSKASTKLQENTSVGEDNSSLKKPRSEIDEIFGGKKRKKTITKKTEKPSDAVISSPKKTKKRKKDKGFEDVLWAKKENARWPCYLHRRGIGY